MQPPSCKTGTNRVEKKYRVQNEQCRSAVAFLEALEPLISRTFVYDMTRRSRTSILRLPSWMTRISNERCVSVSESKWGVGVGVGLVKKRVSACERWAGSARASYS